MVLALTFATSGLVVLVTTAIVLVRRGRRGLTDVKLPLAVLLLVGAIVFGLGVAMLRATGLSH